MSTNSTPIVEAFVLVDDHEHPALLPAELLTDGPRSRLRLTYDTGATVDIASSAALPGSDLADLERDVFDDGAPLWIASLSPQAPAGLWVHYWTLHVDGLSLIHGLWRPDRAVPALHVRGYNSAGAAVVLSVPLVDPARLALVEALISTDQARLLEAACAWNATGTARR